MRDFRHSLGEDRRKPHSRTSPLTRTQGGDRQAQQTYRWFTSLDVRATLGDLRQVDLLPGIKYRIADGTFVGAGMQFGVTNERNSERRIYFQLELASH